MPWQVLEKGFDPAYSQVAESVFSLGNEYTGLRGYFEEGYSGQTLQGSYVNGLYETRPIPQSGYKSMLPRSQFMVNTVDWVYTRLICNGQMLDLAKSRFERFERSVDFRTGVLTRSFDWLPNDGTVVHVIFERFLSMENTHLGGQRIWLKVLKGQARLSATLGLDFSRLHVNTQQNYWECTGARAEGAGCRIVGATRQTGQKLLAACVFDGMDDAQGIADNGGQFAGLKATKLLREGEQWRITRLSLLTAAISPKELASFEAAARQEEEILPGCNYDQIQAQSARWWQAQWRLSDIEIEGDEENQQGIRYSIFQLHQTMHGAGRSALIGAKGLSGEAYNGNTFWEAEVYCLPFYLFNNPRAAKSILQFRYNTLPQAKQRAAQLDCKGAYYPIATISGEECCDLWQHANLQLQPSTGVAYGLWLYQKLTGDNAFIYAKGAEMLVEICRMLASRGGWDGKTGAYGYFGVMGPDEFKMMVNHNTYTNFMAKKTFCYTLKVLEEMRAACPAEYERLAEKLSLAVHEEDDWRQKAGKMCILYDEGSKLFEQHQGYYHMPRLDVADIPAADFPLYNHWSYDRIYRSDMSKQPDVLMFMLLHNSEFTHSQLLANFDYYEPRCSHESSLSPLVHSILAAQLGRGKLAYNLFRFTSRIDLDNYNRNTNEGLHTPSIAGSWMNMVYGFGGLRCDGGTLSLCPSIPARWRSYTFCFLFQGAIVRVKVTRQGVSLCLQGGGKLNLELYGKPVSIGAQPAEFALQATGEWV